MLGFLWGIHPPVDDIPCRFICIKVGTSAFEKAETYFYKDNDNDGFYSYEDCDDNDPTINPAASEVCDGVDNDCTGFADDGLPKNTYYLDADNDDYGDLAMPLDTCLMMPPMGYVVNSDDCDDTNASINPDGVEICDGLDNDCNGFIDDTLPVTTYYLDADNDGYGDLAMPLDTCLMTPPMGYVTNSDDCDDATASINPDGVEVCDGIDNDCNGLIDDTLPVTTYYLDSDGDGYGDAAISLDTCLMMPPANYVGNSLDCNDQLSSINPDGVEVCDGIDNDCNGLIDDGLTLYTYYLDSDNDGFGDAAMRMDTCQSFAPMGFVQDSTDCDDTAATSYPGAMEIADNDIDEDCSGVDLYEATKVFPNPTAGALEVRYAYSATLDIAVFDMVGKRLQGIRMVPSNNFFTLDLSAYPPGIYILRLTDAEGERLLSQKVLKI
ncbi:MAG: MopE-related protein [Bacteroidota bacterium]